MPLSKLLKPLTATCRHCGKQAGVLRRTHPGCKRAKVDLYAELFPTIGGAAADDMNPPNPQAQELLAKIEEIGRLSHGDDQKTANALDAGWDLVTNQRLLNGLLTSQEEDRIHRSSREPTVKETRANYAKRLLSDRTSYLNLLDQAKEAAVTVSRNNRHIEDLAKELQESKLPKESRNKLLTKARDLSIDEILDHRLPTIAEEQTIGRYTIYFGLNRDQPVRKGSHARLPQAAVLRDLAAGKFPDHQHSPPEHPFTLMKSETLISVFDNVHYTETDHTHGYNQIPSRLSRDFPPGVYYPPRSFPDHPDHRSRVRGSDTGQLGITTKHLYFSGNELTFRIRYTKVAEFRRTWQGFELLRDNLGARPQAFRTGAPWFPCNLIITLARM